MENDDFGGFFRREYAGAVRTAFVILGDGHRAQELAQEAFTRAYVRWGRLRTYERPGAWVRRVVIRLALRTRDRAAREVVGTPEARSFDGDPALRPDVFAALSHLSRRQRAAVVLHYLDDLPIKQVAEMLGCRESTARVHLHRARLRLGELLGQEEVPNASR